MLISTNSKSIILSDSRQKREITYNFFEVMFQVVTAILCGMKIWHEIEAVS